MRIILVDDHPLFRDGLREIFETHDDLSVVGEAHDSHDALRLCTETEADIVLLDVGIPGWPVTTTVERIHESAPDVRVLILSMYDDPALVRTLLGMNVYGFMLKTVTQQELIAVIRACRTATARQVLSISAESMRQLGQAGPALDGDDSGHDLTVREREVLSLAAAAQSNARIADNLRLTEATVKRHLRNIFVKLNAVSRIDAVNKAAAAGMIEREPGPAAGPRDEF